MSDDLIKFLRTSTSSAYNKVAADLIEKLEKQCSAYARADILFVEEINELEARIKELTLQLLATSGQAADALDKLTKAVEALQVLSCKCTSNCFGFDNENICPSWTTRAVLAELEGGE